MERGHRKVRQGTVVSNRMNKSAVVKVVSKAAHPFFHKVVKRSARFTVHDENNECQVGDWVEIMETRPLSKTKRFRLVKVLKKVAAHNLKETKVDPTGK